MHLGANSLKKNAKENEEKMKNLEFHVIQNNFK